MGYIAIIQKNKNKEPDMTGAVMSHFCHFLAEGNILCDSQAKNVREVVAELARQVARNTAGLIPEEIEREVMLRESTTPTIIGTGLAVPHARMAAVKDIIVAMALSRTGIDFGVAGMLPVKVVILLLTPEDDPGIHLQVLSALAKDFSNPVAVETVSQAQTTGEVMKFFGGRTTTIPQFLRAADVMNRNPVTLLEYSTLKEAIELFAMKNVDVIPVIDDTHELRGIVGLADLLKYSLPEHLLWMDDLSPIYRFQPFSEVLQTAGETKVADFMRDDFVTVSPMIPAIQLAKLFIVNKTQKLLVVGDDNKLKGEVDIKDFCSELFWK